MRPLYINTSRPPVRYDEAIQLTREILVLWRDIRPGEDQPETKRRRASSKQEFRRVTVHETIELLGDLQRQSWQADITTNNGWESRQQRETVERLHQAIGTGFLDATADLIEQTGHYCTFCETPVNSNLSAAPRMPRDWQPAAMFSFAELLLTCPVCRKTRADQPRPDQGDVQNYAWPDRFWRGKEHGSVLPYRYELVAKEFGNERPIPKTLVDGTLLLAYEMGYLEVTHSTFSESKVTVDLNNLIGIHDANVPVESVKIAELYRLLDLSEKLGLTSLQRELRQLTTEDLSTLNDLTRGLELEDFAQDELDLESLKNHFRNQSKSNVSIDEANRVLTKLLSVLVVLNRINSIQLEVQIKPNTIRAEEEFNKFNQTVNLFSLNSTSVISDANFLDRRTELRTITYFKALAYRKRLAQAMQIDESLVIELKNQLRHLMRSSGFWGIWLTVLGMQAQSELRVNFPGTVELNWNL